MNGFRAFATAAAIAAIGVTLSAQGKGRGAGHAKVTTQTKGATHTGQARGAARKAVTTSASTSTATTTTTTTSTTTTSTPPATPPNALSTKIARNPNQLARVKAMLPAGMTMEDATAGFRNQGQFIAALNASRNQGVPFADLQKAMTQDGLSLGQAVKQIKNGPPAPTTPTTPPTGQPAS